MPVTLISTPADPSANSYVTTTEMTAFVNERVQGAAEVAWAALAADDQKRHLITATRMLDRAHQYLGQRVTDLDGSASPQALEFPRFGLDTRGGKANLETFRGGATAYAIDARVKRAVMLQALYLVELAASGTPTPGSGSVRAQLQAEGVTSIQIGNTQESYNGKGRVLCIDAENELLPLIRRWRRI